MHTLCSITWHDTRARLRDAIDAASRDGSPCVVVAARLPLLADITIAENIALPRQYHLGVNEALARLQAREYVARLLHVDYAEKYPKALTPAETFAVLWLRAIAVPGLTVLLESPLASFELSEPALQECVTRCHGLFRQAHAHELNATKLWLHTQTQLNPEETC
jgi:ABC-type lipoprotein export system ATPase subunit